MSIEDQIIEKINSGLAVTAIKNDLEITSDNWHRISESTYKKFLASEKVQYDFSTGIKTDLATILKIQKLNDELSQFAITIPPYPTTLDDFYEIELIFRNQGYGEKLVQRISKIHMTPEIRVQKELGMIQHFEYFKPYLRIIQAASLNYYRQNFISCYLTLLPCIEGIIHRWSGVTSIHEKLKFEKIKNFFKRGFERNPCPANVLFYELFTISADKIITDHFFLHNAQGNGFENFNRHIALHMIDTPNYLTQGNCIRLFTLLDLMLEIYWYENPSHDRRFYLERDIIFQSAQPYLMAQCETFIVTPEKQIFK